MSKISVKHHYVPQFHLKGFLDDGTGAFFVFDKVLNKIRRTDTKNVLFIKNRNTAYSSSGEKTDLLESIYSQIEHVSLNAFKKIQKDKHLSIINLQDRFALSLHIATLYWRLPTSDKLSSNIMVKNKFNATPFNLRKKDGSEFLEDDIKQVLSSEAMRKAYRLMLPFSVFYNPNYLNQIENWQFLFNDPGYFMIGDNPLIKRKTTEGTNILDEFVVPLSKECLLINNRAFISTNLPRHFFIQAGLVMLHQSERFVCCHNREFLEEVVDMYDSVYKRFGKEHQIVLEFFDMLDQSLFS